MALTEQPCEKSPEEIVAEIRRTLRPRRFEEMLGPEPRPGDAEDLDDFLGYLHSHRRPVQIPDEPGETE